MKVTARDLERMARGTARTGCARRRAADERVTGSLTGLRGAPIVARSIQRRDGGGLELDGP